MSYSNSVAFCSTPKTLQKCRARTHRAIYCCKLTQHLTHSGPSIVHLIRLILLRILACLQQRICILTISIYYVLCVQKFRVQFELVSFVGVDLCEKGSD